VSNSPEDVQRVTPATGGASPDETKGRARRRWVTVGIVAAGLAAGLVVGYVFGGNSRDDDVSSAEAQATQAKDDAAQANKEATEAEQALEEEQAQDQQAMEAMSQGFEELGTAVEQAEAADDQAAQEAVDQATKEIESGLEQLGGEVSANVSGALTDLEGKINDAAASRAAEGAASAQDRAP
jgi:Small metal-binding protein